MKLNKILVTAVTTAVLATNLIMTKDLGAAVNEAPIPISFKFVGGEVAYGCATDVGYTHARERVINQIAESTRTAEYTDDEINKYILVQRCYSDETLDSWKNSAIAGGVVMNIPAARFDIIGNEREQIIPGRVSIGAYEYVPTIKYDQ